MNNFFKWASAFAAGAFGALVGLVLDLVAEAVGYPSGHCASIGLAVLAFLFVLWDCYRWDWHCGENE